MRDVHLSGSLTLVTVFVISYSNCERTSPPSELGFRKQECASSDGQWNSDNGPGYDRSSDGKIANLPCCRLDEDNVNSSSQASPTMGKSVFQQSLPFPDLAVAVISRMMTLLEWKTLVVICDTHNEQRGLDIIEAYDKDPKTWTLLVANVSSILDVYRQLLHVSSMARFQVQYLNILVVCRGETLSHAIEQASVFQAETERRQEIGHISKWLFVSTTGTGQLPDIRSGIDNIALIELPSVCGCHDENQEIRLHVRFCNPVHVRTLMYGTERSRYWDVVGNVMTEGEVSLTAPAFPNTQNGLNMRELVIGTREWDPFVIRSDESESPKHIGFCVEILHHMSLNMNFSYVFEEPPDGEWGRYGDREWTGLIGLAQRREVDLTMAPLTTSDDRQKVVDFAYPFYLSYAGGLFKLPASKHSVVTTWLEPFQYPVILCLGLVLVGLSIQLHLIEKYGGSTSQNCSKSPQWLDTVMYVFGAFIRCTVEWPVVSRSGRVLVSSLWIFTIIIAAAYSGHLIATLTRAKDDPPFSTIADVTQQTEYTWGTSGGSLWYYRFETATEPVFKQLWEGVKEFNRTDPRVTSFDLAVHCDKVQEGSYVFFTELDMVSVCARNSCDLQALEETFSRVSYASAFPKGSPLAQIFSKKIMDMENFGLIEVWKEKWWPKQANCDLKTPHEGIKLGDVQSTFYVLGGGIASAVTALVIEHLLKYYKTNKQSPIERAI